MHDFCFHTKPYQHQSEAFDSSAKIPDYALLMDMGTGKTKVCLDTLAFAYEERRINLALIVAPKGVIANWVGEIKTHLPERIERSVVLWKPTLT